MEIKKRGPIFICAAKKLSLRFYYPEEVSLLLLHKGVSVVFRRNKVLLDGPGRYPAQQVDHGSGLVVGARTAGSSEGLLSHHGSGGLVVNVEVPRTIG